jgi:hypothetical protein
MFCGCVVWLSYDTQDVEYDAPTTPKHTQLSPPLEMGIKCHPMINTKDMWTKSLHRPVFTCPWQGVGVRRRLPKLGGG